MTTRAHAVPLGRGRGGSSEGLRNRTGPQTTWTGMGVGVPNLFGGGVQGRIVGEGVGKGFGVGFGVGFGEQ